MKKIVLTLSVIAYSLTCVTFLSTSHTNAAFPVTTTSNSSTQTAPPATQLSAQEREVASEMASSITTSSTQKKALKKSLSSKRSGSKSQVVALILCILVGSLGIHRFYLGYTWQGIVQLLTLGGCGIWALIDLIRIITGDLGPKDGSYDKTL